jgi:hypothetical protein
MTEPTRRVFAEMVREEWRMHAHLFGGRRFAAFPLFLVALVAGAMQALTVTETTPNAVLAGLHGLALVFGLHTGTVGFVGRDALRDLLGEVTLVAFTARTLPLSQRRLLGIFVVKDVAYYAVLFLLPIAVGALPALLPGGALAGRPPVQTVALLWATLTGSFVVGIAATLAGVGLSGRGVPGLVLLAAVAGAVGLGLASGADVTAYTPYGVFRAPTAPNIAGALALATGLFVVGALTFDASSRRPARTARRTFRRWLRRFPGRDPVATKTLLDVHRSSGGFGKVLFSAAVLLGVTAALTDLAGEITGVEPSVGLSFGTVLGLTAFTTYNWLTQLDDVSSYLALPVDARAVYRAKGRAFLLLGPLVGLAFYSLGAAWVGGRPLELLVGAVVLVGVACYSFGVTVALTGLSPNEFLFDTVLFATFTAAIALPLVPILVVAFALAPVSPPLLGAVGAGALLLAGAGLVLFRRAVPKWHRRHRA